MDARENVIFCLDWKNSFWVNFVKKQSKLSEFNGGVHFFCVTPEITLGQLWSKKSKLLV